MWKLYPNLWLILLITKQKKNSWVWQHDLWLYPWQSFICCYGMFAKSFLPTRHWKDLGESELQHFPIFEPRLPRVLNPPGVMMPDWHRFRTIHRTDTSACAAPLVSWKEVKFAAAAPNNSTTTPPPTCTWEEPQVVDGVAVPSFPTGKDKAQLALVSTPRCHRRRAMCYPFRAGQ